MVMPFSRSRSMESMARSAISPRAWDWLPWRSMASTRVVLPWSTWAMMATLRRSVRVCIPPLSPVFVAATFRGHNPEAVADLVPHVPFGGRHRLLPTGSVRASSSGIRKDFVDETRASHSHHGPGRSPGGGRLRARRQGRGAGAGGGAAAGVGVRAGERRRPGDRGGGAHPHAARAEAVEEEGEAKGDEGHTDRGPEQLPAAGVRAPRGQEGHEDQGEGGVAGGGGEEVLADLGS